MKNALVAALFAFAAQLVHAQAGDPQAQMELLAERLAEMEQGTVEYRRTLATIEKIKEKYLAPRQDNPGDFIEAFAELKTGPNGERYAPGYRQRALVAGQARARNSAKGSQQLMPWISRGPGNVSGRVRSIVIDAKDASGNTWFAASIGGGIWRTRNAGQSWANLTDELLSLSTTSLAQSQSNPDVLYAGTGMGFGRIVDLVGSGVWKSTDHGDTWTQLPATANGELLEAVNRIIVDPNNPDIVLLCSNDGFSHLGPRGGTRRSGIFKSTDGGATWRQVFNADAFFGASTDNRVQQLLADPNNFNRIYAAVNEVGVIRTDDAGETWSVSANNFALQSDIGNPPGNGFGLAGISVRTELAISPSDPQVLYAAVERPRGVADLYVTRNGGDSWQLVSDTGNDPNWFNAFGQSGAVPGAYVAGWFDNTLTVHPTNADIVFVAGVNVYQVNVNRAANTRSTVPIAWWTANNQGIPFAHADHHHIQTVANLGSPFALVDGNDGGIALSSDGGASWTQLGGGLVSTQFYGVDKRPGSNEYIGGTQDNGSWRSGVNPNALSPWTFVRGGDGFEVAWNARDANLVIAVSQFGSYGRSTDGGFTFTPMPAANPGNAPFITKIANSKIDPDLLFTVGLGGVGRSDDFGESWTTTPVNGNWLGYRPFANVEISVADPQIVWISSRLDVDPPFGARGGIHVSSDGGLSFSEISHNLPAGVTEASGIATHPSDPQTAYLLLAAPGIPKVLRTTDLGQSWEDISGFSDAGAKINLSPRGFPDVPVYSLLAMPYKDNELWAATDIGLVISTDGGASWQLADNGFPKVATFEMSIVDGQILAATQGRGIWTLDHPRLVGYEPPPAPLSPRLSQLAMRPDGKVQMNVDLRSPYDSSAVSLNGSAFQRYSANSQSRSLAVEFVADKIETAAFEITAQVGDKTLRSPRKTLSVYPVQQSQAFQSSLDAQADQAAFIESGLTLSTPAGFQNAAFHTPHPYANARDYTVQLRDAFTVPCSNAMVSFDEVAIVEPGGGNGVFGNPLFFDYAALEGSRDGINWLPIGNGVDARANGGWLTTYNAGGSGTSAQYQTRAVDVLSVFDPGEQIFLRFRVFADPGVTGWGYAVDNINVFPGNDGSNDSCLFVGREGISGAWFAADRNGEGWLIESLPDGRATVYWFTYPAQVAGGQSWLIGTGTLANGVITLGSDTPFQRTSGGAFGEAFDPDAIELEDWGTARFTFDSCDSGVMTYSSPVGFGAGEIAFQRLTDLSGIDCRRVGSEPAPAEEKLAPAAVPLAGVSGSWINPEESGHGFIVEVLDDGGVVVVWFVYTPDGEQAWIIASAGPEAVGAEGFTLDAAVITDGTVFGPGFDPDAVDRIPWGTLTFSFDSCGTGTVVYESSLEGWGSGSHFIQRLSRLNGSVCAL